MFSFFLVAYGEKSFKIYLKIFQFFFVELLLDFLFDFFKISARRAPHLFFILCIHYYRHRSVVDEFHLHVGTELPTAHFASRNLR